MSNSAKVSKWELVVKVKSMDPETLSLYPMPIVVLHHDRLYHVQDSDSAEDTGFTVTELDLEQEAKKALDYCREENGRLKITTPYLYPDGDYIDLYLTKTPTGLYLTDLGETLGYLADYGISFKQSPKRRKLLDDVLLTQGAELFRGELRKRLDDWTKAAWVMTRLGQAIVQVSNLVFTLRLSALR